MPRLALVFLVLAVVPALLADSDTGAATKSAAPPAKKKAAADPGIAKQIAALSAKPLQTRMDAVRVLMDKADKAAPAVNALIAVLTTSDGLVELAAEGGQKIYGYNPVQNGAVQVLAKIGKPAIQPMRTAFAKADPDGLQLAYLLDALARVQQPEATTAVHEAMRDTRPMVRRRAADALASNTDPATVDVLIAALADENGGVRSDAASALERLTGQKLGEDAAKWQEWRATTRH